MGLIALHLQHPKFGLRVEECVYPNHLAFTVAGEPFRGRIGGRGGNEETLDLNWWVRWWDAKSGVEFNVIDERRGDQRRAATPARLNGTEAPRGQLNPGDRLEWRELVVLAKPVPYAGKRVREMTDLGRTDDAALEVFADWLEANGSPTAAEYARGVIHGADRERMEVLARQLPLSLRTRIARGVVERCERACGQRWKSLATDAEKPWLKKCARCAQEIAWCDNPQYMSARGPVVFCPSAERRDGDLFPMMVVG